MATARREERQITETVTVLELGAAETDVLGKLLEWARDSREDDGWPWSGQLDAMASLREALEGSGEAPADSTPVAMYGRLRITSDMAARADGWRGRGGGYFRRGDIVTVRDPHPDDDGDIRVLNERDGTHHYLAATGPNALWERVS